MKKLYGSKDYWFFIIPALAVFTYVHVLPFISGFHLSLTDWDGIRGSPEWVGLSNFADALKDESFIRSIRFSISFVLVSTVLINTQGFLLALLVTRKIKGKNIFRTFYFIPNLIGGIILGFIWQYIFTQIFDSIGTLCGHEFLKGWLADPYTGFWGLVIVYSWKMSGYTMTIYIASIENIPIEIINAGKIDGAGALQRIRHIIFPLIAPAFSIGLFLIISSAFKLFDENLSLTDGGPFRATEMMSLNIYVTAFRFNKMGTAQAKAMIFFILVSFIGIAQYLVTRRREIEI